MDTGAPNHLLVYDYILDNLISFGFSQLDKDCKGYVTGEDIQAKYGISDRDLRIILEAFDPRGKNRIRPKKFRKIFKLLVEKYY